ncbi:MAG: hypothetical protein LBH40_03435, partial [Alphaproteobacteria bacterium]|nr:hypothetical protein [Alphaproteobacteria bacterium]
MNFLKKIFFNSIYKELLQNFFSNKNKLNYSLVGFGNPYNSSSSNNEYNFLILNRDDNNRSSSNRSSTRSSNASSSGSSSNRTINSSGKTSKYSGTNRGNYASRNSGNSDDGSEESIESTLKKHKAVRLPTFSVRDKVKEAHKDRIKTGNGYNSNIKELVQQNRKNREEQAIRLQTAKNIDQEEVGDYISALSTAVEGKGIVNNQLKVLAFMIFALIVIMFVIGTFLNQANPLVPILSSINKPLSIKIIDNKDIKIFETKRESRTLTYASNISKNFENAFIALHALNELIYQKSKNQAQEERIPIESIRIDQDFINYLILDYRNYINSPRESIFRANTSIFGTISDVVIAIPNTFLDWANSLFTNKPVFVAGFELLNEFEPADQPLLPDNKIDTYYINEMAKINENVFNKNDFYVINGCKIFKDPEDLSSPACEFSSINIIMTKMYQPDNTGFLARYINPIKDYLLINWLKERVSLSNFFELFLNMTYFGNYQIGMKSSFIDYFEKIAPDTMDVPHALFMIKLLYDNNKNY